MANKSRPINLKKIGSQFLYAFRTFILRQKIPYLFILVITDTCNLDCFYCESKNSGKYHFPYASVQRALKSAYARGHRSLVITGGEPTLWQDSDRELADLIDYARHLGFFDVFIYLNDEWKYYLSQGTELPS